MKIVKKRTNSKNNPFLANFHWILFSALLILTVYFAQENLLRGIVVIGALLLWVFVSLRKRDPVKASILTLLLVLPFNITIAFPSLVDPYISGVYVNYLVPVVSILDIFMALLLSSLISRSASVLGFLSTVPKPFYIFFIYFGVHYSLHPELTVVVNCARLLLYGLGAYFVLQALRKDKEKGFKQEMLWTLTISVAIQLVIGLMQFSAGRSIGLEFLGESKLLAGAIGTSFIKLSSGEFLRSYGTFPHPNILAGYLLFVFFAAAIMSRGKKLALVVMILSSFLMTFTFSRVAIVMLVISWLVIGYMSLKKKGLGILVFERFGTLFTGADYALEDRIKLMKQSFGIIKENVWTGVGMGNFTRALEGNVPYAATGISLLQPVHNVPLLMISEHGLLPVLVILVWGVVEKVKQILRSNGFVMVLRILGMLSLLAIALSDHYLLTLPQGLLILLISLFL